jgi:hypothetical protein
MPTENTNPGNFANYPDKEVKAAASKGGKSGTENKGFASENYDDEKQVSRGHKPPLTFQKFLPFITLPPAINCLNVKTQANRVSLTPTDLFNFFALKSFSSLFSSCA